jgi:hypothetical protein
MADLRTSFTVLEDVSTQAGVPLHRALEGQAASGKNAHGALIAKDGSGNLQYVKVNANRELVVTTDSEDYASLSDTASVAGSASFVDVVTIPLVTSAVYRKITAIVGCLRDAEFKLVHDDDGTPADIALGMIISAGKTTGDFDFGQLEFTAGATGTQNLILQAKNFNALSDFRGLVACQEVQ